jgi:hypothetical protein
MYAADNPIAPIQPTSGVGWLMDMMTTTAGRSVSATRGAVSVSLRR